MDWASLGNEKLKGFRPTLLWVEDRWAFLTECCYTEDPSNVRNPVRLIPPKPQLQILVSKWETERLLAIPKSRKMLISWALSALELGEAMSTPHSSIYVVSINQTESDRMIKRHAFIYDHLPSAYIKPPIKVALGKGGAPTHLRFPDMSSEIIGTSNEPDNIKQESATLIRFEEYSAWEQRRAEETWRAVLPVIQGGGRLIVVGNARANTEFEKLVFDRMGVAVGR